MSTVSRVMDMFDNLDYPKHEIIDLLKELRTAVDIRLLNELPDHEESTGLFKTVYRVEVLSTDEYTTTDIHQIAHDITEGDSSGEVIFIGSAEISKDDMAKELLSQGSDPSFLIIDFDEYE
jgi:hypothetical protein